MHVCDKFCEQTYRQVADKTELIEQLKQNGEAVVVLDYTLFDINDIEELEILHERFPLAKWILFSFDLSSDFVRRAIALTPLFSVLLKDSSLSEICDCLRYAARGQRFICQRMAEILLAPAQDRMAEDARLTRTEMEILKDERNSQLYQALSKLNDEYRLVLILLFFEGMSKEEAALVMGKSKKQIYNLTERGKNALKEELLKMGFEYEIGL